MKKILDLIVKRWGLFFMAASLGLLGAAYFFEYALGYQPCELCLYQRYPYMIIVPLGFLGFLMRNKTDISTKRAARGLLMIITLLLGLEVFLAAHHIGVEQGYWEAFTACTGAGEITSIDDLPETSVPCDERRTFLGISFAEYNLFFGIFLGWLAIYTIRRTE